MGEDGKALFHADHGNLASPGTSLGSVADITVLGVDRKAMRGMKALDGVTPINAAPKYLLVGPELETAAEQVLAQIFATTFTEANRFTVRLTLLVEPRITDESWYLFADPAVLSVLDMEFRVVLDFGCGALDWRGAYLNPGG